MPAEQTGHQPTTRGQGSLGGPHTNITASGKATGSARVVPVVPNSGPGDALGAHLPVCACGHACAEEWRAGQCGGKT